MIGNKRSSGYYVNTSVFEFQQLLNCRGGIEIFPQYLNSFNNSAISFAWLGRLENNRALPQKKYEVTLNDFDLEAYSVGYFFIWRKDFFSRFVSDLLLMNKFIWKRAYLWGTCWRCLYRHWSFQTLFALKLVLHRW